ncbi:MAG: VWA domain-containing protein [Actinomycetota bacterium]
MADFTAEVFQNEYLAANADVVDAVVTVTSAGGASAGPRRGDAVEVIVIDTSGSMAGDRGRKIVAARNATQAAIDTIDDGVLFAVVSGTQQARIVYPEAVGLVRADETTRIEAKAAVSRVQAKGGTAIGSWLLAVAKLLEDAPDALAHAILLTDGKNESESDENLQAAIDYCVGRFQCDARGLGTDWEVDELRRVASALLGTVDIVPDPDDLEAEFEALTRTAMGRESRVALRMWTPKGSTVEFVRQVSPTLEDLGGMAEPVNALTSDYPLGAWSGDESRDYHVRIRIPTGNVGDERLAARVMLDIDGDEQPPSLVRAVWTDDEGLSTRINAEVAHYTGQAELAEAIHEGLAARESGDDKTATVRLGRAVQLAHEAGNDDTVKLLQGVVDVEDPVTGTVRLKRDVETADEMALDVRSTRTVRVRKAGS